MKKKQVNSSSYALSFLIFFLVATVIVIFPKELAEGAEKGLKTCASIIIPCLFPFTVISVFAHKSGGIMWIGKKLNPISTKCFGLNGEKAVVVFMSLIGGYPIGAKIANNMYNAGEISKKEAENLIMFSINAGPTFFISTVGVTLLNSKKAGIVLFLSNTLSCLFLTFIIGKTSNRKSITENNRKSNFYNIGDSLVLSVYDTTQIFLNITAWVTLFSALSELIKSINLNNTINLIINIFLEVTVGVFSAFNYGVPYYIYSFILGFGGFSTICQILSSAPNVKPSLFKIILGRIVHGTLSSFISYLLLKAFPIPIETFSNNISILYGKIETPFASIFLIITAITYFIYLKK